VFDEALICRYVKVAVEEADTKSTTNGQYSLLVKAD
jgi:hypothetical protein